MAREIPGNCERVILVGGDTTFTIVASEFLRNEKESGALPPLAFAGTGSANDVCRALDVHSFEKLCLAVRAARIRAMDVGSVRPSGAEEPLLFLGNMSLGLGTSVNRHIESLANKGGKAFRFGVLSQALAGVAGVRRSFAAGGLPRTITLGWGRSKRRILFSLLTFSNIGYYANGLRLAPSADPFDKRLTCVTVNTGSFLETLRAQWAVRRGVHEGRREFNIIQASRFTLSTDQPLDIQLDGEIHTGVEKCVISTMSARLPVFVGKHMKGDDDD